MRNGKNNSKFSILNSQSGFKAFSSFPSSLFPLPSSLFTSKAFTTIELIIVIIIVGILAASITYKVGSMKTDTTGVVAVDQVIADIQYVQVRAMGNIDLNLTPLQRSIVFTIGSNTYSMSGETRTLPSGVTVTATDLPGNTLTFNSLGEPTFGSSDKTITLTGGTTVKIYAITGKVEEL